MGTPIWLLPNVLSLDAPVIAVLWQGFLVAVFDTPITLAARVSLGLAVWAIYIADRLLDTREPQAGATTARHAFHSRHRLSMSWLLAAVILFASWAALFQVRLAVLQ